MFSRCERDQWVPDAEAFDCHICNVKFGIFNAKHHCRCCGKVACSSCLVNKPYKYSVLDKTCKHCIVAKKMEAPLPQAPGTPVSDVAGVSPASLMEQVSGTALSNGWVDVALPLNQPASLLVPQVDPSLRSGMPTQCTPVTPKNPAPGDTPANADMPPTPGGVPPEEPVERGKPAQLQPQDNEVAPCVTCSPVAPAGNPEVFNDIAPQQGSPATFGGCVAQVVPLEQVSQTNHARHSALHVTHHQLHHHHHQLQHSQHPYHHHHHHHHRHHYYHHHHHHHHAHTWHCQPPLWHQQASFNPLGDPHHTTAHVSHHTSTFSTEAPATIGSLGVAVSQQIPDTTPIAPQSPSVNGGDCSDMIRQICTDLEIKSQYIDSIRSLKPYDVAIVCDDSGSMAMQADYDNPMLTRWAELKRSVGIILQVTSAMGKLVDVYFLNRGTFRGISCFQDIAPQFASRPSGMTNTVKVLKQLWHDREEAGVMSKPLVVHLFTDGHPTDGHGNEDIASFAYWLRCRTYAANTFFAILLCTDDEEVCNAYRPLEYRVRGRMGWNGPSRGIAGVDVTEDFRGEKQTVMARRGPRYPFSFGDYVAKCLVGAIDPQVHSIDLPNGGVS